MPHTAHSFRQTVEPWFNSKFLFKALLFLAIFLVSVESDSVLVTTQRIRAPDRTVDKLLGRYALVLKGNTMIVGAEGDVSPGVGGGDQAGAVYIFTQQSDNSWTDAKSTKIFPSDLADRAQFTQFGCSAALDGDVLVVGACGYVGSVFIFIYSPTTNTWVQQQKLVPPYNTSTTFYGRAVAISGTTIAVGAYAADVGSISAAGSVFIYDRVNSTWSLTTTLTAGADAGTTKNFGAAVTMYGDTLVVGSPGDTVVISHSGSCYVYRRDGAFWVRITKLVASVPTGASRLGSSLAMDQNIIVAGAITDTPNGIPQAGSVFIFVTQANTWQLSTKLFASDAKVNDKFGQSVAVTPNTVVVGASNANGTGAVYVFQKATTWQLLYKLLPVNGSAGDSYGSAVSMDGTGIAVGAPDVSDPSDAGAAYFTYITCPSGRYGQLCQPCSCQKGLCSEGITGDGTCASCLPGTYGTHCNLTCTCVSGRCDDGVSGTGKCLCPANVWGANCDKNCTCQHGDCNSGATGDGSCISCNAGYFGSNCDGTCTCNVVAGICNFGLLGDGKCTSCDSTHYGDNCQSVCSCANGVCNSGITGTGQCLTCMSGWAGTNCDIPCSCENGFCYEGISGDGHCLKCDNGYYGSDCNHQCTCQHGICFDGVTGNGTCATCSRGYYGASCDKQCSCNTTGGICNEGLSGTGSCYFCYPGFWGSTCNGVCDCSSGTCLEGVSGDGSCINGTAPPPSCFCVNGGCKAGSTRCSACYDGYYGANCDQPCTCHNGICKGGVSGDGTCIACNSSWFGANCDKNCSCVHGVCNDGVSGTGNCIECLANYYGNNCQYQCSCTTGVCNDGLTGDGQCLTGGSSNSTPTPAPSFASLTWIQKVLSYQRYLQRNMPINTVQWLMAHHSHAYPNPNVEGLQHPTSYMLAQTNSYDLQLKYGARVLGIDVHLLTLDLSSIQLYACYAPPGLYQLCYGSSPDLRSSLWCQTIGAENFQADTGCFPDYDRTWQQDLQNIANWLATPANKGEFVIVEINWTPNRTRGDDVFLANSTLHQQINAIFPASKIFKPTDYTLGGWPSTSTLAQQGKVVMFACNSADCVSNTVFGALQGSSFAEQNNYLKNFDSTQCKTRDGTTLKGVGFVRVEEDSTQWLSYWDGPSTVGLFEQSSARSVLACGLSVSFDNIAEDKSALAIWSWDSGEPSHAFGASQKRDLTQTVFDQYCAYFNARTVRWRVAPCTNFSLPFACQSNTDSNVWAISSPGSGISPTCTAGYSYAPPRTAAHNDAIYRVSGGQNVWINAESDISTDSATAIAVPTSADRVLNGTNVVFHLPPRNGTRAYEPRFCSLPSDAQSYDCNWDAYLQSVAAREWGMILLFILGVIVTFVIGIYLMGHCCHCRWGKRKYRFDDDSSEDSDEMGVGGVKFNTKQLFFLPLALIVVGSIIVFIGDGYFTVSYQNGQNYLDSRTSDVSYSANDLSTRLFSDQTLYSNTTQRKLVLEQLTTGLNELQDHTDTFNAQTQAINWGRNFLLVIIVLTSLIVPIIGYCLGVRAHKSKVLLFSLALMVFVVFWTTFAIVIHGFESVAAGDVCSEVNYQSSMFDLWYSETKIGISLLAGVLQTVEENSAVQACASYDTMCALTFQLCSNLPCDIYTLNDSIRTVGMLIDDSVRTSVVGCVTGCTNGDLRPAATDFNSKLGTYTFASVTATSTLNDLAQGLMTLDGQSILHQVYCVDARAAYGLVIAGCVLLLLGQFVDLIMLISLNKS